MSAGTTLLQLLVAGLGTGSIYGLVALGFNVVFKSTGAMNFAQGEWVMMGGMITAALIGVRVPLGLAALVAIVLVGAIGIVSERLVIRPVRDANPLVITLVTVGLAICSESLVMLALGRQPVGYAGFSHSDVVHLGAVVVQTQTLWIIGISIGFLLLMHVFFEHSTLGMALRATAADLDAASLVGVRVRLMIMLSFGLAALAGCLAGVIVTPLTMTSYDQGAMFGFKGFSAAMLGGIGSLPGAVVGGLVLGMMESLGSFYISSDFKDAISFAVLLVILFLRPAGLLGQAEITKV